jgi:hypothetical protein
MLPKERRTSLRCPKVVFDVTGITSADCSLRLEKRLRKKKGILKVQWAWRNVVDSKYMCEEVSEHLTRNGVEGDTRRRKPPPSRLKRRSSTTTNRLEEEDIADIIKGAGFGAEKVAESSISSNRFTLELQWARVLMMMMCKTTTST